MPTDEQAEPTHESGDAMQSLHPSYASVLRIRAAALFATLLIGAWFVDAGPLRDTPMPEYALPGAIALITLYAVLVLPGRRYRAWGYAEGEDELAVRRGLWVRTRTIVPFGRVQHIDVAQGPVERRYGLATLVLHTAGTRSASVPLPGLLHAEAEAMRDRIRAKIRQDMV